MSLEVGMRLAGYRIDGVLGRGGMGVVYRATELALDRPVALKLVAPELAGDASFRERFLRESRLAASLDHPGILPVYAAGEADGEVFLAARYVEGQDLAALLRDERTLPAERALDIAGQVADALDAAHGRGLVHRDVKPGNVLVDANGHCYLADFGLTTELGAASPGRLAGSIDYLAPEQIRHERVDGRADQYALACMLYELLTGTPPFRRDDETRTLWAHLQEPPAAPLGYDELEPVFQRALSQDPDDRYATCDDFVDAAREALGLGPSPVAIVRRRRRIARRMLAAGAGLAVVAVTAAALALGRDDAVTARANSLGVLETRPLELASVIPVGNTPTVIAASDRWIWVINSNDGAGTISRIDAETRERVSTFSVGGSPRNVVAAFDSLWVGTTEGRVHRVEPSTDLVEQSWTLRNAGVFTAFDYDVGAGWLATGPRVVWAGSLRTLSSIDPRTGRLRAREAAAWGPMTYGFGSVWVLGGQLARVSPADGRLLGSVDVAGGADLVTGFGSVWVADEGARRVLRVDPRREAVTRTYALPASPLGVAAGADAVWVTTDDGTVARIDPDAHEVAIVEVGGAPRDLEVGGPERDVWFSVG
jgi:hypothetical protein